MSDLKLSNDDLIEKIRTDSVMNKIYCMAQNEGMSELEMLTEAVLILLQLKDEIIQEKLKDELMRSPPYIIMDKKDPEPFDISEYKFNDDIVINRASVSNDKILIWCLDDVLEGESSISINIDDVIAMAKALGVTGEDL